VWHGDAILSSRDCRATWVSYIREKVLFQERNGIDMKILLRGGSIAAGTGVRVGYADILAERLRERGLSLINRSRARDSSFEGNWTFSGDIDPVRPEVLIIHFGIDDIYRPVYRSEFKENLVQLVRLARARFDPAVLLCTSHTWDDEYEMRAADICYRTVREVALDLACEYVPVHLAWMSRLFEIGRPPKDFLLADDRLPNEEGHRLYANILWPHLEKFLAPYF